MSHVPRPGYAGSVGRSVTGQDFPVAPEFLTSMSGQLLSVQQVIEDATGFQHPEVPRFHQPFSRTRETGAEMET